MMTHEYHRDASASWTVTMRSALLATALAILVPACRQTTAPLAACAPTSTTSQIAPPWPATVSGCWLQHGVDTYDEFHLVQQGAAVSGTYSLCGALTGCTTTYPVTGTVMFPHVVLHWTEVNGQRYDETFGAMVTAAADSLVGSVAVNGQPPGPTTAFVRTASQ